MQPEIDYTKIGQRIKKARLERGINQSQLGEIVGCSNNHISHIEVGQTKVSLPLLMKISLALGKEMDFFLLDTPYVKPATIIDDEIGEKLKACTPSTLISVSKIIDVLLEQQAVDEPVTK